MFFSGSLHTVFSIITFLLELLIFFLCVLLDFNLRYPFGIFRFLFSSSIFKQYITTLLAQMIDISAILTFQRFGGYIFTPFQSIFKTLGVKSIFETMCNYFSLFPSACDLFKLWTRTNNRQCLYTVHTPCIFFTK